MLLVQDLNIEADVIPIFNFTHTGQAEAALLKLFRQPPGSVLAILERQHIIQGFRQNWAVVGWRVLLLNPLPTGNAELFEQPEKWADVARI